MEVDEKELRKQRRENILNSGKYAQVEIIVAKEDIEKIPINIVNIHGIGIMEMKTLMICLEKTLEELKKEYPEAYLLSKLYGCDTHVEKTDIDDD